MSFETEGFLGASGEAIRTLQVANYAEAFRFADECSHVALKLASRLPQAKTKFGMTAGILFARSLSYFQAAVILCERGLAIEAQTLCRGIFETVFVLAALAAKAVTPAQLVSHDLGTRKKHAGAILPHAIQLGHEVHRPALEAFIKENSKSATLKLIDLAKAGGLQTIYDGIYRHLSHHSAHPSISAADSFLVETPDGKAHAEFRFDPSGTADTLNWSCHALLIACSIYEKACGTTPEINSSLGACLAKFEHLNNKRRATQ